MLGLFFLGIAWLSTAPSSDQVCRQREVPGLDALHGVDGQPTCQQLIDQLDAQAAESRRQEADFESRITEIESRLNL